MLTAFILIGLVAAACVPFALSSPADEGEDDMPPSREDGSAEPDQDSGGDADAGAQDLLEFIGAPPEPVVAQTAVATAEPVAMTGDTGALVSPPASEPDALTPDEGFEDDDMDAVFFEPLRPVDGDTPDVPGQDLPDIQPLQPVDPDRPDIPGVDLEDVTPLSPVEDPDPFGAVEALLKEESAGPTDEGQAVTDFAPGQEVLEVTLFTDLPQEQITMDVRPSDDGNDGLVTANGQTVAVLRGAPGATVDDVALRLQAPPDR